MFSYPHLRHPINKKHFLILFLYLPFGLFLVLMRCVLALILSILLFLIPSKRFFLPFSIVKTLQKLFGIFLIKYPKQKSQKMFQKLVESKETLIVASNHTTAFDILPHLSYLHLSSLVDNSFFSGKSFITNNLQKILGSPFLLSLIFFFLYFFFSNFFLF